ncbi:MAG: DUF502 domain-containing protein [Pseudomonadota bacterium]
MRKIISSFFSAIKRDLKRNIIAGFLVLVPIGATFSLVRFFLNYSDKFFKSISGKFFSYIPRDAIPGFVLDFPLPGLGLIFLIMILFLIGLMARNIFGRKLVQFYEDIIERIPILRKIYNGIKQIIETILTSQADSFKRAVLIEYPRKGIYTMAFVTGVGSKEMESKLGKKLLSVFVPTTPNPTSGFYLFIPEKDMIDLNITVDVAFKSIISGGIVTPEANIINVKK